MLTLNIEYDVLPDRVVTIKLPETVSPGRHALVLVLQETDADKNLAVARTASLMQFAGSVTAFDGVDGVEYQRKIRSDLN